MIDVGDGFPVSGDPARVLGPEQFLAQLEPHERLLIELKQKLYEGSWERMLGDLRARLDGHPYIYKLSQIITRDIGSIERLKAYELTHGVDLAGLLKQRTG